MDEFMGEIKLKIIQEDLEHLNRSVTRDYTERCTSVLFEKFSGLSILLEIMNFVLLKK